MPFHVLLGTLLSGGLAQGRARAGAWQANSPPPRPPPPKKKICKFCLEIISGSSKFATYFD